MQLILFVFGGPLCLFHLHSSHCDKWAPLDGLLKKNRGNCMKITKESMEFAAQQNTFPIINILFEHRRRYERFFACQDLRREIWLSSCRFLPFFLSLFFSLEVNVAKSNNIHIANKPSNLTTSKMRKRLNLHEREPQE